MASKSAAKKSSSKKRRNYFLDDEILAGFDRYKYSSKDTSPLAVYVLHPFWNWIVYTFIPEWVAPNLLTFLGFLCVLTYYSIISYYDPYFESEAEMQTPRWVWFAAALLNFLAHTLDGIDGKQARKTGTGSPLGELFDHGLDSLTTGMFAASAYSMFGATSAYSIPRRAFFLVALSVCFNFISAHWEKYNTGLFCLPWTYDLSLSVISLVYLMVGIYGNQLFHFSFPIPVFLQQLTQDVAVPSWFATNVLNRPNATTFFYQAGQISAPEALATFVVVASFIGGFCVSVLHILVSGSRRSFLETMRPLIPCFALFLLLGYWISASPSDIIERHPRIIYWSLGTAFAQITSRLIVSQMSSTRCAVSNPCLPVLAACVVFCCFLLPRLDSAQLQLLGGYSVAQLELFVAVGYAVYVSLLHVVYWIFVVYELRCHLRIRAFHIPYGRNRNSKKQT